MNWCVTTMEKWKEVHTYPNNNEHELELTCHCKPTLEFYDNGWRIVNHNEEILGDVKSD